MVIIEVMREFDRWEALLGEHRWSEVFKNPRPENRDMVSQVFYCTYNTGRQVQKYGESNSPIETGRILILFKCKGGSVSSSRKNGLQRGALLIGNVYAYCPSICG